MKDIATVVIALISFFVIIGFALKFFLKRPLKEIIDDIISFFF